MMVDDDDEAADADASEPSANGDTAEDGALATVDSLVGVPTVEAIGSEAAADDELPCVDAVVDADPTELGDAKEGRDKAPRSKGDGGTDGRDLAGRRNTWKRVRAHTRENR